MEAAGDSHIRYVAAIQQPHHEGLRVHASCCIDEVQRDQIEKFAQYKLQSIEQVSSDMFSNFCARQREKFISFLC